MRVRQEDEGQRDENDARYRENKDEMTVKQSVRNKMTDGKKLSPPSLQSRTCFLMSYCFLQHCLNNQHCVPVKLKQEMKPSYTPDCIYMLVNHL